MTSINESTNDDLVVVTANEYKAAKWIFNKVAPNSGTRVMGDVELPTEYEKVVERVVLAVQLDMLMSNHEAGDNGALLQIIDACLQHDIPVPKKLTRSFHEAVNKWQLDFESLDHAFGAKRPNLRKAAEKRKAENEGRVYFVVSELHRCKGAYVDEYSLIRTGNKKVRLKKIPIDEHLFNFVGGKLGFSQATTKKYYYSAKAGYADKGQLLVKTLGNSRLKFQEDPERAEFIRTVLKLPQKS